MQGVNKWAWPDSKVRAVNQARRVGIVGVRISGLMFCKSVLVGAVIAALGLTDLVQAEGIAVPPAVTVEDQALKDAEAALLEKVNLAAVQMASANGAVGVTVENAAQPSDIQLPPKIEAGQNSEQLPEIQTIPANDPALMGAPEQAPVNAALNQAVSEITKDDNVEPKVPLFAEGVEVAQQSPSDSSGEGGVKPDQKVVGVVAPAGMKSGDIQERLAAAHARNLKLVEALDDARRRLMLAETEIERLSSIIEDRRSGRFGVASGGSANSNVVAPVRSQRAPQMVSGQQPIVRSAQQRTGQAAPNARAVSAARMPANTSGDLAVVTVTAPKANLRSGPGLNHSPLMTVSSGTRLVVERRDGDWYRVVTPNGSRAWVVGSVVTFGASESWSPSSLVQVKSFDPSLEQEAVQVNQK